MRRFAKFSLVVLLVTLAVILWGAFVRATGSGAGCGSHWPMCNGVVIPRSPTIETLIELTHRVTSGLVLALTVLLVVFARRALQKGHPARTASYVSLGLMLSEALVGAGLVLFELVANDTSLARGFAMVAHLINTFLLLAALGLTTLFAYGEAPPRLRSSRFLAAASGIGLLALLVLGASGAVAALGDTLFPSASLAEGIRRDFSEGAHLFERLRVLHPLLAILTSLYLLLFAVAAGLIRRTGAATRAAVVLGLLVAAQMLAGIVNLVLLAPVWMQLVHLLLADLVWLAAILVSVRGLAPQEAQAPAVAVALGG